MAHGINACMEAVLLWSQFQIRPCIWRIDFRYLYNSFNKKLVMVYIKAVFMTRDTQ